MDQREIKFRAWDKHRKAWITEPVGFTMSVVDGKFHIFGFDDAFADMYQVKIELHQYTGLKDKNGVEIYEGDIVRGPSNTAVVLESAAKSNRQIMANFEVKWSPHQFWGSWVLRPLTKVHRTYPAFSNCEVIGNIYENPELLKHNN